MNPDKSTAIDIAEAAYSLEVDTQQWLPQLLEAGKGMFDLGSGVAASLAAGASPDGQPLIVQMTPGTAGPGVLAGLLQSAHELGAEMVQQTSEALAGGVSVFSECRTRWPKLYDVICRNTGCKDFVNLWAFDPDLHGTNIVMPSKELVDLSGKARGQWLMLAVHITAGNRIRRRLRQQDSATGIRPTDFPLDGEALIDPARFSVSEATGGAKNRSSLERIREAAMRVDRARGRLRKSNPDEALEIWHGLVRGRWSLVDWFDTDGRRFVLAKPNAPDLGDPRGLSVSEAQVATYAARGESGKIIGYRFGISPQRVSVLLKSAMRKLGVKTQAQLVERMRGLPDANTQRSE